MSDYTLLGRSFNTVRTDNSFQDAGQPTCVAPQEYGHDASGKQEIQDFALPSSNQRTISIPNTASNQSASTAQHTEPLYQSSPRRRNSFYTRPHRRSWTDSRETYQNSARREYLLLLANPRQDANHLVTLKYFKEFTAEEICMTWSRLKALLIRQDIVAYSVIEITTRPQKLSNGMWKDYPTNRVHYHFLVKSDLPERQLRKIFNSSCVDAGLAREVFEVHIRTIPDRKVFERTCKYVLKFDTYKHQAILFQPETGINKVCSIGTWFINVDGTRANKDKMWKSIVSLFPKKERVVTTGAVAAPGRSKKEENNAQS